MLTKRKDEYDEGSIVVYKNLEGVKKRPSMYIGDIGETGYHHMMWEIIDNSFDEAIAGHCSDVTVQVCDDESAIVVDNGRGIPVANHPTEKISSLDVVMTMLHAGGKFGGKTYSHSGGLHGVGASVVNALSEWMEIIVSRDGSQYHRRYESGTPVGNLRVVGKVAKKKTGTRTHFKPSADVFKNCSFDRKVITKRLRELAFLNAGLKIRFIWKSEPEEVFSSTGGLPEYVRYLINGKTILHDPIHLTGEISGCRIDLAFAYDDQYDETVRTFANNIPTIEGGVHQNAILDALCKVLRETAESSKLLKGIEDVGVNKSDVVEGLTLVLNVFVKEPQFGGQTKTKLGNAELRGALGDWFVENITQAFKKDKALSSLITTRVVEAIRARDAARKAKSLSRKKSTMKSNMLMGKLADCSSRAPELCELYVVEGDSAAGCLHPDTLVRTAVGPKKICDIIPNRDFVMTHDGTYRLVTFRGITNKKRKIILNINGELTLPCSFDHPWLIQRDGELLWIEAQDIQDGDLLAVMD